MALNPQLVAELVRQRLGEPDASNSARYILLIPDALKATARKIAANVHLRDLLLTERADATAEIIADGAGSGNGFINLKTLYGNFQILKEFIDCGQIYISDSIYPLQKIPAHKAALTHYLQGNFVYYYIEGDGLYVVSATSGTLSFAVPYYPKTLAGLPESEEVETMFISKICELANMPNDLSEDGEK